MTNPLDTLNNLKVSGNLPSMPQVLVQLIDSCHDPEIQMQAIARIVDKDAAISAKILQLVNSSLIGARRAFNNLEQAVVYLGADAVRNLAISVSVQQIFRRVETNGLLSIDRFWHHSTLAALIARNTATTVGHADASEAYLAGLLHDIGKLLLWMAFPGKYAPLLLKGVRCHSGRLTFLEEEKLHINHCEAGAWLCEQWRLPAFLADALRYHHHPVDEVAQALPLSRIVSLCDMLAHGEAGDPECLAAADRFFRLAPFQVEQIYDGVEAEVEQIAAELGIRIPRNARTSHDLEPEGEEVHKEISLGLINRVRDISQLSGLLDNLLRAESLDRIVAAVEQGLKILFNEDACLLLIPENSGEALRCLVSPDNKLAREVQGLTFTPEHLGDSLAGRALRQRQMIHSLSDGAVPGKPPRNLLDAQLLRLLGTEGMAVLPLVCKEENQGLLLIGLAEKSLPLLGQMAPLTLMARHAALRLSLERLKAVQAKLVADEGIRAAKLVARKVAHDINNPVAILRNYVHLLGKKIGQGLPVEEELNILDSELARIGQITLDLEDLALAQVAPRTEPVDLHSHLTEILRLFQASLPEDNRIRLVFQPCPEPLVARADSDRLRQIMHNLLGNALDALADGGQITVRTASRAKTADITVEDDGPGIDPAVQATLFTPGPTTKGSGHGGLGLSIVESLAARMGGGVACASQPGKTVFTVSLPA